MKKEMSMGLDDIANEILANKSIHALLAKAIDGKQPLCEHPFKKLVEYQRDAYAKECLSIDKEGFQVGEPWNGDIKNACVAFISSNPAFSAHEYFPRYHAGTKTISMPDGKQLSFDKAREFFERRFKDAHITDSGVLQVKCLDRHNGACHHQTVPYWGCVRNSMETLWPNARKPGDTMETYVRRLMSKAVSMELVPFKSSGEKGVPEALPTCLRNFARHILPHMTAPIIVLVGKKVRSAFMDFAITSECEWGKAKQAFGNGDVYHYNGPLFSGEKLVVSVKFNVGIFNLSNSCPPSAIQDLQAVLASSLN